MEEISPKPVPITFVSSIAGLHRLYPPAAASREFRRVLKPGGTLVLSFPNDARLRRRLNVLLFPLVRLIRFLGLFRSREEDALLEVNSGSILTGGNNLTLVAEKSVGP